MYDHWHRTKSHTGTHSRGAHEERMYAQLPICYTTGECQRMTGGGATVRVMQQEVYLITTDTRGRGKPLLTESEWECDINWLSQTAKKCHKLLLFLYTSEYLWSVTHTQTFSQTLMASTESYLSSLLMWLVMLVLSGAAEMGWMTVASCACCW